MASTRKLSNEEVSALIDGLNDGTVEAGSGVAKNVEYRPYVFGGEDAGLLGDLHTLRLINERFGRQLRNVLLPMLRFMPRISTLPPETRRFDEYLKNADQFVSFTTARADALKGMILLQIPPRLIAILVNSFFGGNGDCPITRQTEFTPTEERILQVIVDGALKTLDECWREIYPVTFDYIGSETNPAFTSFVEGQEVCIISSFVVQLPYAEPLTMEVIYPRQALKQIATILRSKIQRVSDGRDFKWESLLNDAIMSVPLSFVPRIANPSVTLGELIQLRENSVIEIPSFDQVKIFVEGEPLLEGVLGEQDRNLAVRIVGGTDKRGKQ
jgi:flagellar motor switch protein FliM